MTNIFGYCWTYRFITNIEEHVAGYAKLAKDPIQSKVWLLANTPLKDHKVNSIIEIKPHIFFVLTIYCKQVVTTVWNHLQTDTNSDVSYVMITIRRSLQVDKKSSNKRQLNISKVQMWLECKKIHTGSRWNVTKTERDIESISTINSDSKKGRNQSKK